MSTSGGAAPLRLGPGWRKSGTGFQPPPAVPDREESREIYLRYCDSRLAKKILKWKIDYTLEDGIREVIKNGVIFDRWENFFDEQN